MNGHTTGTQEILETIRMVQMENLDIRTVTMGIDLQDCAAEDPQRACDRIYEKITRLAGNLVPVCDGIAQELGLPIVNKRVAVTPMAVVAGPAGDADRFLYAEAMERAAREIGINFIGGFSALVEKGFSQGDELLLEALPRALAETERVCASFNVASTRAGINMTAVHRVATAIKRAAEMSEHTGGLACAKLVVFCNAPQDNPFMAGAFHGVGEAECTLNVGVSGPGVVLAAVRKQPDLDLGALATEIKRTAFKITRAGELVGRIASDRLGVPFGILDLSLAPTPAVGDSVARILEAMGLERAGTHGSTAALAMLNDAVKKGGLMASSYVGGLSGAFIPVSEDEGMIESVESGCLNLDKLEAMTAVCSVGIDMVAVPGDTPVETIAAILADECAIGMINRKTTAVRIIPVPGGTVGDKVEFGGLLGTAPIMAVHRESSAGFINRGGRIPAPVQAYGN